MLHGFTQTGRLWGRFGDLLAESHTLITVDLPGHGDSGSVRTDLPTTAGLVGEAARTVVGDGACALLGYSLGARVALHVAIGADLPLSGLVLIGVTAGIEDPATRESRREADDALADELEASGDVEGFVDAWLHGPLFERLAPSDAAGRSERLRNSASGLASSLRLCGTGTQEPLWDQLPTLSCPVLALAGSDDTRFASSALRVARLVPYGVASLVPGGGHAVHLAQPEPAGRIVRHWLDAVAPGRV
jgi:2-succinyl-6-hydroxy-2,4-cyclohexadiene-1-carboxylate synthase